MSHWQMNTAVAFFVFNRPDTTERVFEAIRRAAPPRLFIVADGPRPERVGEAEKCAAVREIVSRVDWPCEVLTEFSDINLGCKRRVSSGLDWLFRNVEEAIILEDDCLPDPTFFRFCEELLHHYRNDERVMIISGDNFQHGAKRTSDSYYFSRYPHIWGWATWRRTWEKYDAEMRIWPQMRDGGWLHDVLAEKKLAVYWRDAFEEVSSGELDTWDHQLTFSCMMNNALCVMPTVNLVSNIGFGPEATHTKVVSGVADLPAEAMRFPLVHPVHMVRDARADALTERTQHRLSLRQALGVQGPIKRVRKWLGFK